MRSRVAGKPVPATGLKPMGYKKPTSCAHAAMPASLQRSVMFPLARPSLHTVVCFASGARRTGAAPFHTQCPDVPTSQEQARFEEQCNLPLCRARTD